VGNKKAEICNELVDNLLFYQKLGCNMSFKILFLNYQRDIFPENWGIEQWAWHMFSSFYLSNREDIPGQMVFTNVCGLFLDGNKSFSWTCVQTAGEYAMHLIKASKPVYVLSWV
jgi:hypothetical protein